MKMKHGNQKIQGKKFPQQLNPRLKVQISDTWSDKQKPEKKYTKDSKHKKQIKKVIFQTLDNLF